MIRIISVDSRIVPALQWAPAQSDQSSRSTWRNLGFLVTHWAHSEDLSDWVNAQADLSLCWAHRSFCWFCHAQTYICFSLYLHIDVTVLEKTRTSYHSKTYRMCTHWRLTSTCASVQSDICMKKHWVLGCLLALECPSKPLILHLVLHKWAASWQNQQSGYAHNDDSDQPGHPPSLIRAFAVCSMCS